MDAATATQKIIRTHQNKGLKDPYEAFMDESDHRIWGNHQVSLTCDTDLLPGQQGKPVRLVFDEHGKDSVLYVFSGDEKRLLGELRGWMLEEFLYRALCRCVAGPFALASWAAFKEKAEGARYRGMGEK